MASRLLKDHFLSLLAVGWGPSPSLSLPPSLPNDYCYLIPDQLQRLHCSRMVAVSHAVSHSAGNYIFSLVRSLSDSLFNGDQ